MAVLVIVTVIALSTSEVKVPNYIPTLQANPGGRNDMIKSYFC